MISYVLLYAYKWTSSFNYLIYLFVFVVEYRARLRVVFNENYKYMWIKHCGAV